jgi:hypothetical protein
MWFVVRVSQDVELSSTEDEHAPKIGFSGGSLVVA